MTFREAIEALDYIPNAPIRLILAHNIAFGGLNLTTASLLHMMYGDATQETIDELLNTESSCAKKKS